MKIKNLTRKGKTPNGERHFEKGRQIHAIWFHLKQTNGEQDRKRRDNFKWGR